MKITLDDIEPGDTVVAVLGAVGSGKSTFINAATESGTSGAPEIVYGEVQVSKCLISGTSTVLLEVPSSEELGKFLVFVSKWLEKASKMDLKIAGVIYIHSINNINHALDSLPFIGSLDAGCASSFQSIVLVTSMWGTGTNNVHSQRERQLITDHWKPFLDRGSTAVRFLNTTHSALYILSNILPCNRGTPPTDPRYSQRIDAQSENGHYPHVSLLAALLHASNFSSFGGSGVNVWKEAVRATLTIMNTPKTYQGHRYLFRYIASFAIELLFAISVQVKAGLPYLEVAHTVYYLNRQLTRLLPLPSKGASPVRSRRWPHSPRLALLKDCKLHIEATRQFFEETTLLGLQGVIDRIEARISGRSSNEYEPSLAESQYSSIESYTSEYSRGSVSHQDGAQWISNLQHADRFLEVKYMAQTKGALERLEILVTSSRLSPIHLGPQAEGSTPFKTTVLQAGSVTLHGLGRIAHLQQSITRVESFVKVGLANCAVVPLAPRPVKETVSNIAPITVESLPSNIRSEKPPYPKLVFDARLLSHSPKNSPATPTHWKPNSTYVDKGSARASPVIQVDCATYTSSFTTSFLREGGQRQFKPSFSSLAPFIPEVDATLINKSNPSTTSYTSHRRSISVTTHNNSNRLDVPHPFQSLGTIASTSAPHPVGGDADQADRRTTSSGTSSFSSLIGLHGDQLVERKEHAWSSSRETAPVNIHVNSLFIVEGDHFCGTINNIGSVNNSDHVAGDVFYGSILGCTVGGRSNNNDVKNDLNDAVRVVTDYKPY